MRDAGRRLVQYLGGIVVSAIIAGVLWVVLTPLPGYVVDENLGASMSERGLASVFAADVGFVVASGVVGLAAGIVAWLWFHRWGWWVCVVALLGATIATLLIWGVGSVVTPGAFDERLAAAGAGDVVPIQLELRSRAALLVAPFSAITPVMLLAAFWPERRLDPQPAAETDHASA